MWTKPSRYWRRSSTPGCSNATPLGTARRVFERGHWSHYDLYDKPEPVAIALAHVVPFFKEKP